MKYRAYVLQADRVEDCLELDANCDFEAVHLYSTLRPEGEELEVWQQVRFVARFNSGGDVRQGPDYIPRASANAGL